MEESIKLVIKLKLFRLYEKVLLVDAWRALEDMLLAGEAPPALGLAAWRLVTLYVISPFARASVSSWDLMHLWSWRLRTISGRSMELRSCLLQEEIWSRWHDAITIQNFSRWASFKLIIAFRIGIWWDLLWHMLQAHQELRVLVIQLLLLMKKVREVAKELEVVEARKIKRRRRHWFASQELCGL